MRYLLAIAFTAAPFVFGLIRYLETGSDLRMLWMAGASFIGALAVWAIAKSRKDRTRSTLVFSIATLVVSTLFAGFTAILLGATSGPGGWMVAFVLGLCWMARYILAAPSHAGST